MLLNYLHQAGPMRLGQIHLISGEPSETADGPKRRKWVACSTIDAQAASLNCREWNLRFPQFRFTVIQPPIVGYPFSALIDVCEIAFLQLFPGQTLIGKNPCERALGPRPSGDPVRPQVGCSFTFVGDFEDPEGARQERACHAPEEFSTLKDWARLWETYFRGCYSSAGARPRLSLIDCRGFSSETAD